VRLYRSRLPAPEDLVDAGPPPREGRKDRADREAREPRPREDRDDGTMAWFRMNVGRQQNADPRWLLPIICRLGHVTKKEVGPIRIFDRDTKFGIVEHAAGRFAASVRRSSNEEDVRIEPASGGPEGARGKGAPAGGKPPYKGGHKGKPHGEGKAPYKAGGKAKPYEGKAPGKGKPWAEGKGKAKPGKPKARKGD
jgi:ATP-dependent RNA helicase DeaD